MNNRIEARLRNEDGIVLIITMLCIVALIGIVGLVVDSGMMEYRKLTLQKAANAATLRASQLYYDGENDPAKIEEAVKQAARINLLYSGLESAEAERSADTLALTTDTAANTVSARLSAPQQMYFAQVMPGVERTREMSTVTAASYLRKEGVKQHHRHLFIVTSVFFTMGAPFQTKGQGIDNPQGVTSAPAGSKVDSGIDGLKDLIDLLDGERLTLIGTGAQPNVLTESLPIDDQPSSANAGMSNRDYAKLQSEALLGLNAADGLGKALRAVVTKVKKLSAAEREEALVLVISDGISLDIDLPFSGFGCADDPVQAMEEANRLRSLGVTVSTVGLFSNAPVSKGKPDSSADVLTMAEQEGRAFLKSLAAVSSAPVECDSGLVVGGQKIHPSKERIGTYLEPRTAREVAIYLDGTTSKETFIARLPRRVKSK